jgi:crotonobetainyl-CoA:carnitine CoA-transferase CaiB-like acyl-CoA transferase
MPDHAWNKATWDDPQLRHRGLVQDADTRPYIGCPIHLSDTPAGVRTPPAVFGQHTDEVLGALGYTPTHIAGLRERGVV